MYIKWGGPHGRSSCCHSKKMESSNTAEMSVPDLLACSGYSEAALHNTAALFLRSEVTASCTGHSLTPIGRSRPPGWRWRGAAPDIILTHPAADWPSPSWASTTRERTAATAPKSLRSTPPPMSLSKVRPAAFSHCFRAEFCSEEPEWDRL